MRHTEFWERMELALGSAYALMGRVADAAGIRDYVTSEVGEALEVVAHDLLRTAERAVQRRLRAGQVGAAWAVL